MKTNSNVSQKLLQMRAYALENDIPIIEDQGLEYLLELISKYQPENILEIGTAMGYSAMQINNISEANIITFERNTQMIDLARANFCESRNPNNIELITEDFLKYDTKQLKKVDLIYIDGAKAQYYNFFKHAEHLLNPDGIVVFDNLQFHGYVYNEELKKTASRNLKQLIRKIETFLEKIKNEPGYKFQEIAIGDGIGILLKENIE